MNKKLSALILIAIGALAGIVTAYTIPYLLKVPTSGTVHPEYGLTANATSIDWGTVNINVPVMRSLSLKNTGTKNINHLNMTAGNFSDNIIECDLTWNLENQPLMIGETKTATFTLTIYSATQGEFHFDIWIRDKV